MKPVLSYTIWFSQRTGSSLLCRALEETGIAGRPNEWLLIADLMEGYRSSNHRKLQEHLWEIGSTSNGIFGLKYSLHEPRFRQVLETFRKFPNCPQDQISRVSIWEHALPNHRHIFMTRRNKVRLAVSWWKAIQTQEWFRYYGQSPRPVDLTNAYSYDAINHLYCECTMREAGIQEFFSEGHTAPLTIVYEDFILEYEMTIGKILELLELDTKSASIPPAYFTQLADDLSEAWAQRFRQERQNGWENRGW